jgi:hypothetical protein
LHLITSEFDSKALEIISWRKPIRSGSEKCGIDSAHQLKEIAGELESRGICASGVYQERLGNVLLFWGATSCPSSTAVHLRAGWNLGGVRNAL